MTPAWIVSQFERGRLPACRVKPSQDRIEALDDFAKARDHLRIGVEVHGAHPELVHHRFELLELHVHWGPRSMLRRDGRTHGVSRCHDGRHLSAAGVRSR